MANCNGAILEHRWVMSEKIGRPLTSDDIVHHINGDMSDNNPDNLKLHSRSSHAVLHGSTGRTVTSLRCDQCGVKFEREVRDVSSKIKQGQTKFFCSRRCSIAGQGRRQK